MAEDEKTPIDQALDLFVYAPLGLAMSLREQLPGLAARGRQQLTSQVTMARMMGQFAAQQGQREAEKRLREASKQAEGLLADLRGGRADPTPTPVTVATTPTRAASPPAEETTPVAPAEAGPPVGDLAIPGYDTLSASQVVQRLAGLAPEELTAVAAYEGANRRRRTILNRVAQLQAG